jgi:uncharacterized membrane protein YfhO
VDGADAPVLRANYSLRAVPVPAGTHEVVMWYDPGVLRGGMIASLVGVLLIGTMVVVARTGREARDPQHG